MRESIWPPEYDPEADYVVNRPFLFGSVNYEPNKPGEPEVPFDVKTTERQMRVLYGSRFIRVAEPSITEVSPPPVLPPTPASVADDAPESVDDGAADSGALDAHEADIDINIEAVDADDVAEHLEEKAEQIRETVTKAKAKLPELVKKSGGWYDVVDSEGNKFNEKSLRIKDAERLIKEASHDLDVQR